MKVLTIGWFIVFTIMGLINLYIFNSYLDIPFKEFRSVKLSVYVGIHLFLGLATIIYFYMFFNGKTDNKFSKGLSNIAGFHIVLSTYVALFYFIYDLVYFTRDKINYPEWLRAFGYNLFFGGFIIFALAGFIAIMGLYNSKKLDIKNYRVEMDKKSSNISSLKAVYLSDGHINTSITKDNIDEVIDKVNSLNPDVVFLGGDFFDEGSTVEDKKVSSKKLGQIKTKYGIFAVEGNHEYKSGDSNILEEMSYLKNEGIIVLSDEVYNTGEFSIIGRKDDEQEKTLDELVEKADRNLPIIFLNHKPKFGETLENDEIELQLSGHTHNGQYMPLEGLNFINRKLRKESVYGHHLEGKLNIIVSSGVGDWGVPIRTGSRREIVDIEIDFVED